MARIKIKHCVLEAMGFRMVELGDGMSYHSLNLGNGLSVDYTDGVVELVHNGTAVPLNCRSESQIRTLIQIL